MIETFVTGNIGAIKFTEQAESNGKKGFKVLTFSVASHTKSPEGKEVTTWVTCKMWGQRAKALSKHLCQGQAITALGRPEARAFKAEDGSNRADLVIHIDKFEFSGSKPKKSKEFNGFEELSDTENTNEAFEL